MLMDGKSLDTIRRPSSALVQHADSACRLGLARLDCGVRRQLTKIIEEKGTNRRQGGLDPEAVQEQPDMETEQTQEGEMERFSSRW